MDRRVFSLALLALLAAAPAAANAEDAATVGARITAAMQSAKSFVVTTTASTGFSVTMTFVAPDRYHSALVYNGATRDVVLVGSSAYVSEGGGQYRKLDAPPEVVAAERQMREIPVERVLPDKLAGGTAWGRFATTSSGMQKDQHLICSYDKRTYRVAECSNEGLTLLFSRYDDPANAVAVPANVITGGAHR
jgi:hypothetical protein